MDHGHCGLSLSCIIIHDSMKVGPMRNCILEGRGAVWQGSQFIEYYNFTYFFVGKMMVDCLVTGERGLSCAEAELAHCIL